MLERSFGKRLALSFLFGVCTSGWVVAQEADTRKPPRVANAVRISESVQLDGILDEPVWDRAEVTTDFLQQEPDEFQVATRKTAVRFLYDDTTLYVGAMLYDPNPEGLITNDLKREFNGFGTDSFGLVLDTFRDQRTAYGFLTNPGGAMRDTQTSDSGRINDANWNGVWMARTAVLEDGWSLEFAIPFKTLRFPVTQGQVWGLNMVRTSRAINERSTWSPVPRQFSHYNVAYAGALGGISGVQPGNNLYITPFGTGQFKQNQIGHPGWDNDGDGGIDLKWGITSSLLLDGTWRMDFSQVEADEQQINTTRFSLFFPEKRQFFLESPSSFQIGLQDQGRRDIVPFFSRRIGLQSGQPVPVIGGVRLTGRAGRQNVGLMNMQTESFNGDPGDNFTAVVARRSMTDTTALSGYYFGRESGGPNAFNRVAGFDFRYTPNRIFDIEAFAMRSETDGRDGDFAGRTGFLLASSKHRARLGLLHIGDSFQHDLGFVRRTGIGTLYSTYTRVLRPSNTSGTIREHTIGAQFEVTGDDRYTEVLTRIANVNYGIAFADGGQFSANANSTFENIDASFGIGPTLRVQAGKYQFEDVELSYTSNDSAALSGRASIQAGEFWDGKQRVLSGSLRYRLNANFAASASFSRNFIELPDGTFTGDLLGIRLETSFSPRMFLNAFIQYNGETDTWLSNIRYNLVHRPLSDIYVVWNETHFPGVVQRALLLKYTHLIAF